MRSRGIAACAGALTLLASGGLGCGNSEDDGGDRPPPRGAPVLGKGLPPEARHPATAAIDDLQRAFLDDDLARICAGLTDGAARQAGEAGHKSPTACKPDVRRLFAMIRKGGGWRYGGEPRVVDVETAGSSAVATVALDDRWRAKVPLSRDGGRWRLRGFFGIPAGDGKRLAHRMADTPFPPARGHPVKIVDAQGAPCPELDESRHPLVSGGCRIALSGRIAEVGMLTALGYFKFEDCTVDYRFRADAEGRTLIEDFEVEGVEVACGDVSPCMAQDAEQPAPWRGRLYAAGDGTYLHRSRMCLWTCVGTFVGELTVRLIRDDSGWRAEPVAGGGDSGFRFDQPLAVRGGFDVEAG